MEADVSAINTSTALKAETLKVCALSDTPQISTNALPSTAQIGRSVTSVVLSAAGYSILSRLYFDLVILVISAHSVHLC